MNGITRRQAFSIGIAAAMASALPAAAQPGAFPSRPTKLIVPHAPGGNSDTFGRILAQKLSERIGQQVVVENKPGAGGTVASGMIAKSPADGYTLLVADNGTHAIAPTLYGTRLSYDLFKNFTPTTLAAWFPTVIARIGLEVVASSPADPNAVLQRDVAKWGKAVKEYGAVAE